MKSILAVLLVLGTTTSIAKADFVCADRALLNSSATPDYKKDLVIVGKFPTMKSYTDTLTLNGKNFGMSNPDDNFQYVRNVLVIEAHRIGSWSGRNKGKIDLLPLGSTNVTAVNYGGELPIFETTFTIPANETIIDSLMSEENSARDRGWDITVAFHYKSKGSETIWTATVQEENENSYTIDCNDIRK